MLCSVGSDKTTTHGCLTYRSRLARVDVTIDPLLDHHIYSRLETCILVEEMFEGKNVPLQAKLVFEDAARVAVCNLQ